MICALGHVLSVRLKKCSEQRRRAYIACSNCRKRKIKCVTVSDADYRPCTRCSQKGLTCEYMAAADEPPSRPRSPEEPRPAPRHSDRGPYSQPQITPPSAGLQSFLPGPPAPPSSSGGSGSYYGRPGGANPSYPPGGSHPYPYQPGGNTLQPRPHSVRPYPSSNLHSASINMQNPGLAAPQYYNPSAHPSGPNPGHNSGVYNANYGQMYAQQPNTGAQYGPTMSASAYVLQAGRAIAAQTFTAVVNSSNSTSFVLSHSNSRTNPALSGLFDLV
ncbi:hypothetical protein C8R43DRAFT_1238384 [Mycena crocata]|nr:hypothetical protein C8R43DRAFT_1238384 [Mycena crocata]